MSPTRRRGAAISIAAALTLLSTAVVPAFDQLAAADGPDLSVCPWMDTTLTADQRAQLLIDASSQHQKYRWMNEQSANSPQTLVIGGVTYPAQLPCTPRVVYANGAGASTTRQAPPRGRPPSPSRRRSTRTSARSRAPCRAPRPSTSATP